MSCFKKSGNRFGRKRNPPVIVGGNSIQHQTVESRGLGIQYLHYKRRKGDCLQKNEKADECADEKHCRKKDGAAVFDAVCNEKKEYC